MRIVLKFFFPLLAIVSICGMTTAAKGAKYGITDEGHFFSADAATQAEQVIRQIRAADDRDVLVVTFDKIPDDRKDKYKPEEKAKFFAEWADQIGVQHGASGIVILMTRDPRHLEIVVGNKTQQRAFTQGDRNELVSRMVALLKENKYDDSLLSGVKFIKERIDSNEPHARGSQGAAAPPPAYPTQNPTNTGGNFHVGGLVCVGIALLVIVFMVISAASRNRGGNSATPQGGYPPTTYGGGGYPPQAGYGGGFQGGGGGGGFGKGLLGGLLGGAIGSWGYDKFAHPGGSNPNYTPPQGGGADYSPPADQTDTSFSGGGADFGSNDSGGGADFGGGGDSGGGGGDSGGGGGGGDF